ncbi:GAF and ANTAR domain-containing protein [Nocardia wallacei]|uniref:GAF and ANTAR domain-containing protein n=1 Tax=Nocardia wallacei TaxID=480035 RepID=UPI002455C149|nr:GAF and ANTAR domain-containing protein [Nocardia wallacei]
MAGRETALTAALVRLVDTLVADYDPVDLTQELVDTSVDLLHADAAGLLLADGRGELQVLASTSEEMRLLELLQIQAAAGPCLQAFRTGEQVLVEDLDAVGDRWPQFVEYALRQGFRGVCALPMRLRADRIGALNLFTTRPGTLGADDLHIAQALADVATIGILHARILADSLAVNEQLNRALNSRVVIEQAKGMLAERGNLDMDMAFQRLRKYARDTNHRLAELALAVVERTVELDTIVVAARPDDTE